MMLIILLLSAAAQVAWWWPEIRKLFGPKEQADVDAGWTLDERPIDPQIPITEPTLIQVEWSPGAVWYRLPNGQKHYINYIGPWN